MTAPIMRTALRRLHRAIWTAVLSDDTRKAERLLATAPSQYRGVVAMLVCWNKLTR